MPPQVLELRGSIPSRNFARLPKPASKTLGLTGRFCYVQIKPEPGKKWCTPSPMRSIRGCECLSHMSGSAALATL